MLAFVRGAAAVAAALGCYVIWTIDHQLLPSWVHLFVTLAAWERDVGSGASTVRADPVNVTTPTVFSTSPALVSTAQTTETSFAVGPTSTIATTGEPLLTTLGQAEEVGSGASTVSADPANVTTPIVFSMSSPQVSTTQTTETSFATEPTSTIATTGEPLSTTFGQAEEALGSSTPLLRPGNRPVGKPTCGDRLPMPPDYNYGIFDFPGKFVFAPEILDGVFVEVAGDHFSPLLIKLANGQRGKVVVFGGSMTAGTGCVFSLAFGNKSAFCPNGQRPNNKSCEIRDRDCAWPARLKQWLQSAFPVSEVVVDNSAHSGMGSEGFSANIAAYMRGHGDADLVIFDTSVNDNKLPQADAGKFISSVFERLLIQVRSLAPKAGLAGVLAACSGCEISTRQHSPVLRHHHLPELDMMELRRRFGEKLWPIGGGVDDRHPPPPTHQAVADLFAMMMAEAWPRSCKGLAQPPALQQPYLNPDAASGPSCLRPTFSYIAGDPNSSQPRVASGDWRLYEDRPGKPGWIAQKKGSTLAFPVRFSNVVARLAVTVLRSYTNISDARLRIVSTKREVVIKGLWDENFKGIISVAHTYWFQESLQTQAVDTPEVVFLWQVNKAADTLLIETVEDGKVKVISVVGC